LTADSLYRACHPESVHFETTASASRTEDVIGQQAAIDAVQFGVAVQREGYNLFVVGPAGVGKQSIVRQLLANRALEERPTEDWCYVHAFGAPHRPRALALPPGRAAVFRDDLERTVAELQTAVRAALEGEEYRTRRQRLERELADRQERALRAIERQAREWGASISREEDGFTVSALRDGQSLPPRELEQLPEEEQAVLKAQLARAEDALGVALQEFNDWGRQHREALASLQRNTAAAAGARLFAALRTAYADLPAVLDHLDQVEADLADSSEEFLGEHDGDDPESPRCRAGLMEPSDSSSFELRASVNVLIDHSEMEGVPVVYEDHPSYANLMGRIDHLPQFGSLVADFTLIRPGALHRALGGYLVLDAARLLESPHAWDALKRTLRTGLIALDPAAQQSETPAAVWLQPEPIPLSQTKVILIAERELYELLAEEDRDFLELFKVLVDFEDSMDRSAENELRYSNLLGWLAFKDGLHDFTHDGIARVVEHASRLAEDAGKLSICMRRILDLMREADTYAQAAGEALVSQAHVQQAIDAQRKRAGRMRSRLLEDVRHGVTLLDTTGARVGQVNGLSVLQSGEHAFGQVMRITARVWVGKGEVVDIERDVELAGPLHSKGVLICKGLLGARYATEFPLSLAASLVFEQSYGLVEGDSASLGEACALLSALADLPVSQGVAVTGSLNQHGDVQPVGGVNEKVEGFFEVCQEHGLTGTQGVILPATNRRHLMLSGEVTAAVRDGRFHVWTVDTVDDAMQLLTGRPAGARDERGCYPEGTVHWAVQERLRRFSEASRRHFDPAQSLVDHDRDRRLGAAD
jgi:lon-related putative ATP-dependent protease